MEDIIIETKGLTKRYGDLTAVDNLDLSIRRGEVFGLLGPNGAGKTTTTLMLLGLTEPTAGSAFIAGHDCTREPLAVKRMVGYLPDSVGFYTDMTGRENLRFTGRLNGLSGDVLEARVNGLLRRVGMAEAADRKTGTYSRGMRQRLGIADVLLKDPKVIVMDEPTLGIDPEGMRELLALIRELSSKDKRTILISSHQLQQIQQICDRVGIFVHGKLMACGAISELGRQLQNQSSYVLELAVSPDDVGFQTLLKETEGVREFHRENEIWTILASRDLRKELGSRLLAGGYVIEHLHQRGGDLDEIYHKYFEKAGEKDDTGVRKKGSRKRADA